MRSKDLHKMTLEIIDREIDYNHGMAQNMILGLSHLLSDRELHYSTGYKLVVLEQMVKDDHNNKKIIERALDKYKEYSETCKRLVKMRKEIKDLM